MTLLSANQIAYIFCANDIIIMLIVIEILTKKESFVAILTILTRMRFSNYW